MITRPTPRRLMSGGPRRAFTMMEMLISLSITALLMAAMGGAFTAAGDAVTMNDEFFRSVQQGRSAQDMVMTLIRRCQAVTANSSTSITITAANGAYSTSGNTGDFNGDSMTIAYHPIGANAGTVTLTDNTAGTAAVVLAANVSSASFAYQSGKDMSGTAQPAAAVSLTMSIAIGPNKVTFSDSAAPRVYAAALFN